MPASRGSWALINREWVGFSLRAVSLTSLLALLYLVVLGSIVAVNCYSYLLAHVAAQKVATYALVNPVIALALGALVLARAHHAGRPRRDSAGARGGRHGAVPGNPAQDAARAGARASEAVARSD